MRQIHTKKIIPTLLLVISSILLFSNIVLAAVTQEGYIVISGTKDIFYDGYTAAMASVSFDGVTASSSDQDTIISYAGSSPWPDSAFIGVLEAEGSATSWTLTIQGPASLTGGGNTMSLSGDRLEAETSAHKWSTLTLTDSETTNYVMTKNDGTTDPKDIWYWETPSYTWSDGDVLGPINVDSGTNFTLPGSYDTGIITSAVTILSKSSAQVLGVFGVGISFALDVPGGSAQSTYTGNITYTLA